METIVFFDLDGTLCEGGSLQVTDELIKAFAELRKNQIQPMIATGRSFYEVEGLLKLLNVENFILSNGCYVQFEGETLLNAQFSQKEIEEILQIAGNSNLAAGFFNQKEYAITELNELVRDHIAYMGISDVPVEAAFYRTQPVNFMNLYVDIEVEKRVHKELKTFADIVRFAPLAIDVLPKNVSKGHGIQKVLASMEHTNVQTYAFGDQNNDLTMFQLVDHGIAMRHATDELKKEASYVAKTDQGVLEGLRYYNLIP